MAVWSETNLLSIEKNHGRFDAEYYKPEYLEAENFLSRLQGIKLRTACSKIDVGHVGPMVHNYTTNGIPLLQTHNVKEFFLNNENIIKIKPDFHSTLIKSQVRKGSILIARSGSFGSAAIYLENEIINSADIIIVEINNPRIDPLFAVAFMNSKYGSNQLIRFASGGVQGHVNLRILENYFLPIFNDPIQKQINTLVQKAYDAKKLSKKLYLESQNLLESELCIGELKFKKTVGYTAQFSKIEQSRRCDSEHFYPEFQHLVDRLPDSIDFVPLGPQLYFCQRGRQPTYAKNGLSVINSKHVHTNKILLEDNRTANFSDDNEFKIRYGDVLINGTGRGTLGRAAPYLIKKPAIPDNHVTILRSSNLDPAYLSFFLNSRAGQLQVEMHQRGSSGQLELYPFDIRKFLVWVAPKSLQKEVRKLYDQANESERRSKTLLAQAKLRVEQLIEEAAQESGEKP